MRDVHLLELAEGEMFIC